METTAIGSCVSCRSPRKKNVLSGYKAWKKPECPKRCQVICVGLLIWAFPIKWVRMQRTVGKSNKSFQDRVGPWGELIKAQLHRLRQGQPPGLWPETQRWPQKSGRQPHNHSSSTGSGWVSGKGQSPSALLWRSIFHTFPWTTFVPGDAEG